MIADILTAAGAAAGIVATLGGFLLAWWATRLNSKSKRQDAELARISTQQVTELSRIDKGQEVITAGIDWSERLNKALRLDLLAAEKRIDDLQVALRRSETDCDARIAVLEGKIRKLQGGRGE